MPAWNASNVPTATRRHLPLPLSTLATQSPGLSKPPGKHGADEAPARTGRVPDRSGFFGYFGDIRDVRAEMLRSKQTFLAVPQLEPR